SYRRKALADIPFFKAGVVWFRNRFLGDGAHFTHKNFPLIGGAQLHGQKDDKYHHGSKADRHKFRQRSGGELIAEASKATAHVPAIQDQPDPTPNTGS